MQRIEAGGHSAAVDKHWFLSVTTRDLEVAELVVGAMYCDVACLDTAGVFDLRHEDQNFGVVIVSDPARKLWGCEFSNTACGSSLRDWLNEDNLRVLANKVNGNAQSVAFLRTNMSLEEIRNRPIGFRRRTEPGI